MISRLIAYLERFARRDILERLERPNGRSRNAEQTVQAEIDRFVFSEGLYPITHAVAGRGRLDTFIQESRQLIDDAERPGNAALLIELKQALSTGTTGKTTEAQVKAAISDALSQAEEYRRHLEANPRWRGHKIYVVIAYDGETRYRIETPGSPRVSRNRYSVRWFDSLDRFLIQHSMRSRDLLP